MYGMVYGMAFLWHVRSFLPDTCFNVLFQSAGALSQYFYTASVRVLALVLIQYPALTTSEMEALDLGNVVVTHRTDEQKVFVGTWLLPFQLPSRHENLLHQETRWRNVTRNLSRLRLDIC